MPVSGPALADVGRVFREEYGRAVAVLTRVFGDIDTAEDAVQEAFAEAARRWPAAGLPPSPAGWIITTARNRAVVGLRREAARDAKQAQAALLHAQEQPAEEGPVRDDRLRLIFTCCHPALGPAARVALKLRLLSLSRTNAPDADHPHVGECLEIVNDTMARARDLALTLRPSMLTIWVWSPRSAGTRSGSRTAPGSP